MTSNFAFLSEKFPELEKIGNLAENYLYSDPNACLYKLGTLAESIVNRMIKEDDLPVQPMDTSFERIKLLKREDLLPTEVDNLLHSLRKKRNDAVHGGHDSLEDCKALLQMAHTLSVWFMQTYGDYRFEPETFSLPSDESKNDNHQKLIEENEALLRELELTKATLIAEKLSLAERKERSAKAIKNIRLSEKETRILIDDQLRQVGWEVDSQILRHSKGTRPQKNKNLAIAEWPTNSGNSGRGFADYALFASTKLVGIVEAKALHKNISSVIDNQCKDYSQGIKDEHSDFIVGSWDGYKVPFLFASNGRPYLKQFETESGIWFRDARQRSNIPRALQNWISPQGIQELLNQNIPEANQNLLNMPYDLLSDPDGLNLRPYQIEAVESAEKAVLSGKQTALLAMATGTGKTRTVLGIMYRFLRTGRFRRILFLVDRTALGEQAQDVFETAKLEDLLTLDNIYNIKKMDDKHIDPETKIHVATVQGLVQRTLYGDADSMPTVTDYDLIIIDEAHRGYILDKEMSDDELLYRNQLDYVSKYRAAIGYFDAVKIALTATPALHTTEIFGKPVFEYSYRRAVVEGFLVDHDAPHVIETKLSTEGITYKPGEIVTILDPITGEITNSAELADELHFDVDKFNRQVITESFNRTVLTEIADHLSPDGEGKTLIYAANDQHADLIVKLLKEIYEPLGVPNEAIQKITGSIYNGSQKKIQETIRQFKNETYPNIAVTVDLLTTGIDVPKITTLVFMRRVKSRILFEQMLGRATRLCREINKSHFEIYDPVGVYSSLDPVNTMKPASQNVSASFEDILTGLETFTDNRQIANQIDLLCAKLQRQKHRLSDDTLERFGSLSGGLNPTQFVYKLSGMTPQEAKNYALENQNLLRILNEYGSAPRRPQVLSLKEDKLLNHSRGYGNNQAPQDYLEEFTAFVRENPNKIKALEIICTRPRDLTRKELKNLKLELDSHNFTQTQLQSAWKEWKNEDIAADIISFIRRSALGSALIAHDERIRQAVAKLRQSHNFSKIQSDWLGRIEQSLLKDTIIDRETFESGAFKTQGGYQRINKVFNGNLDYYLNELNNYLYEDGGQLA